jgi:hypothetical protein
MAFVFTPPISLSFLILSALFVGVAVGMATGAFACLLLRIVVRARDAIWDGILGAVGLVIAPGIVLLIPWRNTITYRVGNTMVTSTMNHYQHPYFVANMAACLLPFLHEVHRFLKSANQSPLT